MSLYAEYLQEMEGADVLELENGFIAYSFSNGECFIHDIFVRKSARNTNCFRRLGDTVLELAKERKCKSIKCEVWTDSRNPTLSLHAVLSYGFKVVKATENRIHLVKEL